MVHGPILFCAYENTFVLSVGARFGYAQKAAIKHR